MVFALGGSEQSNGTPLFFPLSESGHVHHPAGEEEKRLQRFRHGETPDPHGRTLLSENERRLLHESESIVFAVFFPDLERDMFEMDFVDDRRLVLSLEVRFPNGTADCDASRVRQRWSSVSRHALHRHHREELHVDGVRRFADVPENGSKVQDGIPSGHFHEELVCPDFLGLFKRGVDGQHFVPRFSHLGPEWIGRQREELDAVRQFKRNQQLERSEIGT